MVIEDGVAKDIICLSVEVQKMLTTFSPRRAILKAKSTAVHDEARRVFSQYPKATWWQVVVGNAKAQRTVSS
jgi:hypothetical protein